MIAQPAGTHLAQLNVGHIRYATDDPRMAEFMGALDAVNALAERSPGFVWRLKDDASNNATNILVSDDPHFLVNMSVWETPEQLEHFVWNTVHKRIYQKKGNWFAPMVDAAFRHVVGPSRAHADASRSPGAPRPSDQARPRAIMPSAGRACPTSSFGCSQRCA